MTSPAPSLGDPGRVSPLATGPAPRRWWAVAIATALGIAAVVATYLALAARLPAEVPSHWDAQGQVDGTSGPFDLLLIACATQLAVGILLTAVVGGMDRAPVLREAYGERMNLPVTIWAAYLSGVALPWTFASLFLNAANVYPESVALPPVLLIVPTVVLVLVVWTRLRRGRAPSAGAPRGPASRILAFRCTACGQEFSRPAWYLLAPRVGVGLGGLAPGMASYYLRCPLCGERGWQVGLGWRAAPVPSGPGRAPPAARSG